MRKSKQHQKSQIHIFLINGTLSPCSLLARSSVTSESLLQRTPHITNICRGQQCNRPSSSQHEPGYKNFQFIQERTEIKGRRLPPGHKENA